MVRSAFKGQQLPTSRLPVPSDWPWNATRRKAWYRQYRLRRSEPELSGHSDSRRFARQRSWAQCALNKTSKLPSTSREKSSHQIGVGANELERKTKLSHDRYDAFCCVPVLSMNYEPIHSRLYSACDGSFICTPLQRMPNTRSDHNCC